VLGSWFGMRVRYLRVRGGGEVVEDVVVWVGFVVLELMLVSVLLLFLWVRERPDVVREDIMSVYDSDKRNGRE
jgi:hypothetical protein